MKLQSSNIFQFKTSNCLCNQAPSSVTHSMHCPVQVKTHHFALVEFKRPGRKCKLIEENVWKRQFQVSDSFYFKVATVPCPLGKEGRIFVTRMLQEAAERNPSRVFQELSFLPGSNGLDSFNSIFVWVHKVQYSPHLLPRMSTKRKLGRRRSINCSCRLVTCVYMSEDILKKSVHLGFGEANTPLPHTYPTRSQQ